jgi:2-keto-4-pentenoate hydratase/2-oxohepta-3-ene-1,7-dioic acid hydratase in catechol pathway
VARSELQGNRDLDGRLTTWLGDNAAAAVLVRPHFYVFGAAASPVLQEGSTANLIFGVADTVAWLSRTITLEPGDIIATGTPSGVGAAQGRFLRAGDTVEVEIDGLGAVANTVRAG